MRPEQKRQFATLLPGIAIELPCSRQITPASLFWVPQREIWLEIGFGGGEHLIAQAETHRDIGFIGCEVFENGVAKLLVEIERRSLRNIRLFTHDAQLLIPAMATASIGRVFILFPDPWPKARHHKRRIISTETLDQLARIMSADTELRLATDDPEYFDWMLERVAAHPAFDWLALYPADWRQRPSDWPPTRYEAKARAAGRAPLFLRARRRPVL